MEQKEESGEFNLQLSVRPARSEETEVRHVVLGQYPVILIDFSYTEDGYEVELDSTGLSLLELETMLRVLSETVRKGSRDA